MARKKRFCQMPDDVKAALPGKSGCGVEYPRVDAAQQDDTGIAFPGGQQVDDVQAVLRHGQAEDDATWPHFAESVDKTFGIRGCPRLYPEALRDESQCLDRFLIILKNQDCPMIIHFLSSVVRLIRFRYLACKVNARW